MNNSEVVAYGFEGSIYCPECLPEGVTDKTEECNAMFAGEECGSVPVCDSCDYTFEDEFSLTEPQWQSFSYGVLPPRELFDDHFKRMVFFGGYSWNLKGSDSDTIENTSLSPYADFDEDELWKAVQILMALGTENSLDLVSSIFQTLNIEWI